MHELLLHAGALGCPRGAAVGGGVGAVQGAAQSLDWPDVGQTAKDAGVGFGLGAMGGAAVPLVAGAASRGVSRLTSRLTPDEQALADALSGASPPVR
jgi:hypothetical protein